MTLPKSQRAMVFLLVLAVVTALTLRSLWTSNFERRMGDFQRVGNALEAYKRAKGSYPRQGATDLVIGLDPAASEFSVLVPSYLAELPRDPRNLPDKNLQYLYFSDGKDYKFIAHGPDDMGYVLSNKPELADPRRPVHAYGIWTAGGTSW